MIMAVGDSFGADAISSTDMVFVPSSLPLMTRIDINSLMAHFDDYVYDKSDTTHLYHILQAICGDSGLGQLLNASVRDWLNGGMDTAWLGFVDKLFQTIYGLPRLWQESTKFNQSDSLLTTDEVNEALLKDAQYKARFWCLMNALTSGGTVRGFRYATKAIMYCDCDVYETWRYKKQDFQVGRTGYTLYNEVVITPYDKTVTEQQKDLLLKVLERLKPADSIVTIDMNGIGAYKQYDIRSATASSSYFEIVKTLTNSIDNDAMPTSEQLYGKASYGYDAYLDLSLGESTEVRKPIENRTQEYSEYYVYDKSSSNQIASVSYSSKSGTDIEKTEQPWSSQDVTVKWTAWKVFDKADSPDNYPGGKFGMTPMKTPALNKDGSDYIFAYDSQAAYESVKGAQIIASGGEVSGHQYRTKLSTSSTTVTYQPEMSLISIDDITNNLQMLPEQQSDTMDSFSGKYV